jgi:hypothetical protein
VLWRDNVAASRRRRKGFPTAGDGRSAFALLTKQRENFIWPVSAAPGNAALRRGGRAVNGSRL